MTRRASGALILALVLTGTGVRDRLFAQGFEGSGRVAASARSRQFVPIGRLEPWLAAVESHELGTADVAAADVASWSAAEVQRILNILPAVFEVMRAPDSAFFYAIRDVRPPAGLSLWIVNPDDFPVLKKLTRDIARRTDFNTLVKRAAFLHTDIANHDLASARQATPSGAPSVILDFADGSPRTTGRVDHWRVARDLLEMVMPDIKKYMRDPGWLPRSNPAGDEQVRAWYRATTALLLAKNVNYPRHFDVALELFPDDIDILFHAASLHDRQATAQVQAVARAASLPPGIRNDVRSSIDERRRAEALFRRVLDRAAGHTEARLRLGHILARNGRSRDAVRELRRVVEEAKEPLLEYYGALFLGDAAEATADYPLARKSYERASALYPRAQSPALALSHLSSRNGDSESAVMHLEEILRGPPDSTALDDSDPWWTYYDAVGRQGPTRLEELYRQARGATPAPEQQQ